MALLRLIVRALGLRENFEGRPVGWALAAALHVLVGLLGGLVASSIGLPNLWALALCIGTAVLVEQFSAHRGLGDRLTDAWFITGGTVFALWQDVVVFILLSAAIGIGRVRRVEEQRK